MNYWNHVDEIGYDEWQSRFLGDSAVVGRTLSFGGTVHTVVGVMPEGFAFPVKFAEPSASISYA